MSIHAKCECGNKMMLADVMGGRTIRCSKCGGDVFVPAATSAPVSAKKKDATPSFEISSSYIITAVVIAVVLMISLGIYFGPWAVSKKWAVMEPIANNQVTDVVDFAIKAYESSNGMYDATASHNVPHADGPAIFVPPHGAFSLPPLMIFNGTTNQGGYIGTYNTTNGEIVADIGTGGSALAGIIVRPSTGNIHITGREKDGIVQAEINGKPLTIATPKPATQPQ